MTILSLKYQLLFIFTLCWFSGFSQVNTPDSTKILEEITITTYGFPNRDANRLTNAESFIGENQIRNQVQSSLVGLLNIAPGVRMEERSPGSYRLSLRGSLLRSPFGIRNIKIYIDDFPLTDAGGNTYLNLLDSRSLHSIILLKGPQSSIFGANTGGAILIRTSDYRTNQKEINLEVGSYGLFHQTVKLVQLLKDYSFSINAAYQQSDGYRENSALKRKYFQTSHQWSYSKNGQLKIFAFYSDLSYQTPGGLTEAQLLTNPKAARPATPLLPGAITQQAGIFNETFFAGISNSYHFGAHLHYVTALFGNHTNFKNPFITNFEKRKEGTLGLRSYLNYRNYKNLAQKYDIYFGVEGSRSSSKIRNYGNDKGIPSLVLASDDLLAKQDFAFLKVNIDFNSKLMLELGTSLNFFGYHYESYFPTVITEQKRSFKAELMPKLALSYALYKDFSLRGSIGKGYAPPTLAEVRASDNVINTNLQAEAGWNYEAGLHYNNKNLPFTIDGTIFYFNLKNAIVRRLTATDEEYFINAGGTKQLGTELQTLWDIFMQSDEMFINHIKLTNSFTYNHFKFDNFKNSAQDFTGNNLTGVPRHTVVSGLEFRFRKYLYLFAQHNYTSAIPLNDANAVYARKYHLADMKAGIRDWKIGKSTFNFSIGINNLFNQNYSLGNDLNAANNRYFNPAPMRNYSFDLGVRF